MTAPDSAAQKMEAGMKPCHFCKKPTGMRYSPDIDLEGIPLCDDWECHGKMMVFLHEATNERKESL